MDTERQYHFALYYRIFFLYVEPISALLGSFFAGRPREYLTLLTLNPNPAPLQTLPIQVDIALYQLSNLYLLFALNEHFVLKSTNNPGTWRALLFGLLVADLGHLATNIPLGPDAFWKFWQWNA